MESDLPTEVYLGFLGRTIEVHWDLHAWLMFGVWFGLVPFGIFSIRYLKTRPVPWGLPRGIQRFDRRYIWWVMHLWSLYTAIGLSLGGLVVAVVASQGFSGSLHSFFGVGAIGFGSLQIIAAWLRGSHGGKNHEHSNPDDASTWHGDHYDMTKRRRWFEAYHKTAGYFAFLLALSAVATGLMQFWISAIAILLALLLFGLLMLVVVYERMGYRHDTYRAVFGNHSGHPFNKARKDM
jgi:hypothetical protein